MTNLSFKKAEVKRVVEHAKTHTGQVLLVRDYGVYLVSPDGNPKVAFANGADPRVNKDWSEKATELVGDFDKEIRIPIEDLQKALSMPRVKLNFGITTRKVVVGG
jgi:hypothetical protein